MSGLARRVARSSITKLDKYREILRLHFAQHTRERPTTRSAKRRARKRAAYLAQRSSP